jgi:hypothetical protein
MLRILRKHRGAVILAALGCLWTFPGHSVAWAQQYDASRQASEIYDKAMARCGRRVLDMDNIQKQAASGKKISYQIDDDFIKELEECMKLQGIPLVVDGKTVIDEKNPENTRVSNLDAVRYIEYKLLKANSAPASVSDALPAGRQQGTRYIYVPSDKEQGSNAPIRLNRQ